MTVTQQLRQAVVESGQTHYRIGKETGIAPTVLDRFVAKETRHIASTTLDRLCEYFGLELCRKTGRTGRKQARKKRRGK